MPTKASIAMSKLSEDDSFIVTTATATADPIEIPIPLDAAKKPDALLKYCLGISFIIAVLLAGRKIDIPAPDNNIVISTK